MATATLTSKGQVTIPKEVREALGLETGDRIMFVVRADGVAEVRAATVDLKQLFGILRSGREVVTVERMNDAIRRAASRS